MANSGWKFALRLSTKRLSALRLSTKRLSALLALAFFAGVCAIPNQADAQRRFSMFDNMSAQRANMYLDTRARGIGDLLTIQLQQQTNLQNRDQRSMTKSTSATANLDTSYATGGGSAGSLTGDYNTASDRNFDGGNTFNSARTLNDSFTVVVIDVLPNKNMLVAGTRQVLIEGSERTVMLSGIVRHWDVAVDNSVSSQLVANLEVEYLAHGEDQQYTRQGWLMKQMSKVWPF